MRLVGPTQAQGEDLVLQRVDSVVVASVEHHRTRPASEEEMRTLDSAALDKRHKTHRLVSLEEDSLVAKLRLVASARTHRVLQACHLVAKTTTRRLRLQALVIQDSEGKAAALVRPQHQACLDSQEQANLEPSQMPALLGLRVELGQEQLSSSPSLAPSHPNSRFSASTLTSPCRPCPKTTQKEEGRASDSTTSEQTTSLRRLPPRCCGCLINWPTRRARLKRTQNGRRNKTGPRISSGILCLLRLPMRRLEP